MMGTNLLTLIFVRLIRARLFCLVSIFLFSSLAICQEFSNQGIVVIGDAVVYDSASEVSSFKKNTYSKKSLLRENRKISSNKIKQRKLAKNVVVKVSSKFTYTSSNLLHFSLSDINSRSFCVAHSNTIFVVLFSMICVFHCFLYRNIKGGGFFFTQLKKIRSTLFSRPPPLNFSNFS